MTKIYVGDKGSEIILDTEMDLTGALLLKIFGRKPDFTEFEWTASAFELTKVKHIVGLDEIDMDGIWTVQSYVEMVNGNWLGESTTFEVFRRNN